MGFRNTKAFTTAVIESSKITSWRKQPTQATGANIWFDLSMSPGNPTPNYYIGASGVFTHLKQSTDGGIPHGGNVSPMTKHIHRLTALSVTAAANPLPLVLCDYVGFYPFVDESVTDEQFFDNTNTISRYTDGFGIQIMPVVVAGHSGAGGVFFTVNYTNHKGETGRISKVHVLTSQIVNGTVAISAGAVTNSKGPFMNLQDGDNGVRSIESITFQGTGDVGLLSLVLVKPLCTMALREATSATEVEYFKDMNTAPRIMDDAYLNAICCPAGSLAAAPIHGLLEVAWN